MHAGSMNQRRSGGGRHHAVQYRQRLTRNHRLLIRGDHEHTHARALRRDDLLASAVGAAIQFDADPPHAFQHPLAHAPRVFADATTEDHGVEPLDRRRQPAQLTTNTEDKILDRLLRLWPVRRLQLSHVVRDPRQAFQPGLRGRADRLSHPRSSSFLA